MTDEEADDAYVAEHQDLLEHALSTAMNSLIAAKDADPLGFLAAELLRVRDGRSGAAAAPRAEEGRGIASAPAGLDGIVKLALPPDDEGGSSDKWSLQSWSKGIGLHRALAAALQPATAEGDDKDAAALALLRGMKDRSEMATPLRKPEFLEAIIELAWVEVAKLQAAGAATTEELQNKFAGSIELSYAGLSTFFGGLEAFVGPPNAKVAEGMAAEHLNGVDVNDEFVTGNYGVATTSKIEWLFTTDYAATPESLGLQQWPAESVEKLADRSHCRKRRPLSEILTAAEARNAQLKAHDHTPLGREELIAANLYTGPVFVKYNAVLRGLRSDVPFLRNTMVSLCCSKEVVAKFKANEISFEVAVTSVNRYPNTLHCINSAVVKASKLSKARKVYRGIAGMSLPKEFWEPNEYGVKGGIENAFMSTTTDRKVAMGYAAGDGQKMGIVLEMQQGMVNRGADISWLSQYPHEEETLFGPLTGIEVLGTRIDSSVVVVECAFSVNLTALTIEQVLNKRHRLAEEMAAGMALEVRAELAGTGYEAERAERLQTRLKAEVLQEEPKHFNDDDHFVKAVAKMLKLKKGATDWKTIVREWEKMEPAALAPYETILVGRLGDGDAGVRKAACLLMHKLKPDEGYDSRAEHEQRAADAVAQLEDSEWPVREDALETLGKLQPAALAQHADAIKKVAANDPDRDVRAAAAQVLGKLEPAALAQHAAAVAARLEDAEGAVRLHTLQALKKLEPAVLAQHATAVVAKLADRFWDVRKAALQTLGKLEPAALAQHAEAIKKVAANDQCQLENGSYPVREAAAEVLAKLQA